MEATTIRTSNLNPRSTPAKMTRAETSMTMPLSKIRSSKSTMPVSRAARRTIVIRRTIEIQGKARFRGRELMVGAAAC